MIPRPVEGSNPFLAAEDAAPASGAASPLDRIPELAALLAETCLATLELSGPGGRVVLHRGGGPEAAPACDETPAAAGVVTVASPGIGQFLRAHPLHGEPLADAGAEVAAGQVLALLRVGSLLQPVRAPMAGILQAVHRADGALTGFGDPLFDILPPR